MGKEMNRVGKDKRVGMGKRKRHESKNRVE